MGIVLGYLQNNTNFLNNLYKHSVNNNVSPVLIWPILNKVGLFRNWFQIVCCLYVSNQLYEIQLGL